MEVSIREVKAKFAEAAAAAHRGERVIVTRHGRPFIELIAARPSSGMDFAEAERLRRDLGLDGITVEMPGEFDDAAFSRSVLGLER